jgi:isopentenyldiphosphate isomerase
VTDEILDLVNEHDEVISSLSRNNIYKQKLKNFRVVNAILVNVDNEIWLPIRNKNKTLFPLSLDTSVGGHVKSGESYSQALFRETKEELNIDLASCPFSFLFELNPNVHLTSAFMHVYKIFWSGAISPNYNTEDIESGKWYEVSEAISLIEEGTKCKSDLPLILKKLIRKC